MKFDQYNIGNYIAWGKLLTKWAENPGERPAAGPIKQLTDAIDSGIGFELHADRKYKTFRFLENPTTDDELVIVMPPIKIINDAKADLANGYKLPKFYGDTFGVALDVPEAKREGFHMQRIAEYVMKWCG